MKPLQFTARLLFLFSLAQSCVGSELPTYHTYTLENGLQVVILPNSRAPVVYHSLWYKVGSADSPANKTGLAHFLEHLMFKGTHRFPKDTFKRVVNDLGGEQNANTSWDRTVYFVTIAKEHLPKVMEMEADRMHNLVLSNEDVLKERDVVLQERRSVIDSKAEARLMEATNATFFWEHPYGTPVIGFEEHIRSYTQQDALDFYQQWYTPSNAILIIAGDITLPTVKALIKQYYGPLADRAAPSRNRLQEPNHRGVTAKTELRDPQLGASFFQRIYPAPNFRTSNYRSEAVLTLLQDILGDTTYGRLNKSLIEDQKLAHYTSADYVGYYYDPYSFSITAAPYNSFDMELLEASVEAEVRRLIAEGVTEQELLQAKQQWSFESLYRKDSLYGIANFFGENLSVNYPLSEMEKWLALVNEIKATEIQAAAKTFLGKGPQVTLYAYPTVEK